MANLGQEFNIEWFCNRLKHDYQQFTDAPIVPYSENIIAEGERGIYGLVGKDGIVEYIGYSQDISSRLYAHLGRRVRYGRRYKLVKMILIRGTTISYLKALEAMLQHFYLE